MQELKKVMATHPGEEANCDSSGDLSGGSGLDGAFM
jgi:hypothetical protein